MIVFGMVWCMVIWHGNVLHMITIIKQAASKLASQIRAVSCHWRICQGKGYIHLPTDRLWQMTSAIWYFTPPFSVVTVVSPLIEIMKDQLWSLTKERFKGNVLSEQTWHQSYGWDNFSICPAVLYLEKLPRGAKHVFANI